MLSTAMQLDCGLVAHAYEDGEVVLEIPQDRPASYFALTRAELQRIGACAKDAVHKAGKTAASAMGGMRKGADDSPGEGPERAGQHVLARVLNDDMSYTVTIAVDGVTQHRRYARYDDARRAKTTDKVGERGRLA